jgi:hypothetical protein
MLSVVMLSVMETLWVAKRCLSKFSEFIISTQRGVPLNWEASNLIGSGALCQECPSNKTFLC